MRRSKGEGRLYREGPYYCWRLEGDGKVLATVKARTASERKVRIKERLELLERGMQVAPTRQVSTVSDWLAIWLASHIQGVKANSTYRQYEQCTRLYINPHIGQVRLTGLTSANVRAMMVALASKRTIKTLKDGTEKECALSPRTREAALVCLKVALNAALKESPPLVARNVAAEVSAPKKGAQQNRALSPSEMATLIGSTITIDEVAEATRSTGREVLTALGSRFHRIYYAT